MTILGTQVFLSILREMWKELVELADEKV